jgi:ABC-type sugar transport system ATPase subunit
VTHDQEEALQMADLVAVLNQGRIEQIGTPLELHAASVNNFVADFLETAPPSARFAPRPLAQVVNLR